MTTLPDTFNRRFTVNGQPVNIDHWAKENGLPDSLMARICDLKIGQATALGVFGPTRPDGCAGFTIRRVA